MHCVFLRPLAFASLLWSLLRSFFSPFRLYLSAVIVAKMVRVLLIRHAQSMQNEFREGVSARIAAGELEPSELNATMRNAPALHDAGADSPLTELGEQQAELLGELGAEIGANLDHAREVSDWCKFVAL